MSTLEVTSKMLGALSGVLLLVAIMAFAVPYYTETPLDLVDRLILGTVLLAGLAGMLGAIVLAVKKPEKDNNNSS